MALEVKALTCIRGERLLFKHLNFTVSPGQVCVVEGKNGSGKTSLLRILSGLSRPYEGEIRWLGRDIHQEREEYLQQMAYFGHLPAIKNELTPVENLTISQKLFNNKAAIEPGLVKLGLGPFADIPSQYLSAGQKRRVALANLFLRAAPLWILDEPFTALDKDGVAHVAGVIGDHVAKSGSVVLTTHQHVDIPGAQVQSVNLMNHV